MNHSRMLNLPEFNETVNFLKLHGRPLPFFWELASAIARIGELGMNYTEALRFVSNEEHPKIIQGLLSDTQSRSYIREELMDVIKNL
jgi:hypothetical protein